MQYSMSSISGRSVPLGAALIAVWLALAPGLHAQQVGTISGRVTDASSGAPVPALQVHIAELGLGVLTTQDGRYTLSNVPAGTHSLQFLRIGYRSVTEPVAVAAGQNTVVNVQISQTALALDEVIVTGTPGGTQRRAIGNAVVRLNAADVAATRPITNMQDVLQGRTPGLAIGRSGGNVGEGGFIRIRGVSSLTLGTQPLIYVDGIRMDNSTNLGPNLPTTGAGQAAASALNDLNPNDIESVEVIKGPAAATLYGTEASAGVIQIITKRGQSGAPQFEAHISQGTNFLMNARDLIGDQWRCPTSPPCSADEVIRFNIFDLEKANGHGSPITNGHNQRYNMSVRGGTDQVNYFVSADFGRQEGIRPQQNWDNRMSARANLGIRLSSQLNVDASLGYVNGETRFATGLIEGGGLWPHLMWAQGRQFSIGGANTDDRGYLSFTPEDFDIPEATRDYSRLTTSVTLRHNPFSWLDHRLIAGVDRSDERSQTLFPRDELGPQGPFGDASRGRITVLTPLTEEFSFDYSASARYDYNDAITLTSSAGAQFNSRRFERLEVLGIEFPAPPITAVEGAAETSASSSFSETKSLGVYFQQELGWNNRVFLTGAIRADDSSTFGSDFSAAIYPKFSATWVISEEDFFRIEPVSALRFRTAWGQAGRQPGTFAAVTLFSGSVAAGGRPAVTPSTLGNPDVAPEVSTELELGFDIGLFEDRVTGEFTYFRQRLDDALVTVPVAPSLPFPGSEWHNLGRLDNWGYEAALNARVLEAPSWSFDLGGSIAYTMNEIKDLGGRPPAGGLRLGNPWPNRSTTHLVSGEFDPTTGRPTNLMCDAGVSMSGSDDTSLHSLYGWRSGGAIVPCSEIQGRPGGTGLLLGPTFSPWQWSMDGTVTFRNLQVFGMVNAEHGRWMNDYNISCRHPTCGFPNSYNSMVWTADPLYTQSVIIPGFPTDTRHSFEHDASFVRLRELGARYTLPQSLVGRVGADRANLSFAARNLWYLWKKQDELGGVRIPSPEMGDPQSATGFALFQWPPLTTFEASLRFSF
jgi:TonB-dependent starch-binding outer membrane protein SusC